MSLAQSKDKEPKMHNQVFKYDILMLIQKSSFISPHWSYFCTYKEKTELS